MSSPKKYLIVVAGPTASGKTGLAIQLAQHFQTEIISADSRQFYQEMTIGTAKQTSDELAAAPHHFVNNLSLFDVPYSVGDFEREAIELLKKKFEEKELMIICGGSGLFIKAVTDGFDDFPEVPETIRQQIETQFEEKGLEYLQAQLQAKDPDYFSKVDIHNPRRLIRALEIIAVAGLPYSSFLGKKKAMRTFQTIFIQLEWDRNQLYERINYRVDQMFEMGLLEEVKQLFEHRHINALNTVGYQELFDFFDKKTDLNAAKELIKRNSRRYAKRQMTWLRRIKDKGVFHPNEVQKIIEYIEHKQLSL